MVHFRTFSSSSPLSAAALTACWKLDAGEATTFQPRQPGVFRVTQGAVWATVNGMQHGEPELPGDRLLKAGDSLTLQAGQRLVVEPWNPAARTPVYFSWEPQAEVVWDGRHEAASVGAQWRGGVVQPSRDLAQALRSAGAAVSRLVLGLVGLGDYLVVGRGRAV
nr:DUF2917 domain-containing protein [uncultured Albidiferax sp.]